MPDGTAMGASTAPAAPPATPTEPIIVDTAVVGCDGGDGPLGHPRVWLRLEQGETVCPYCSRRYVSRANADRAGRH